MKLQRVLNTVSVTLALGLVALAAWHVNHPETFHGSALLQVHISTASVSLAASLFPLARCCWNCPRELPLLGAAAM